LGKGVWWDIGRELAWMVGWVGGYGGEMVCRAVG
jgi:hypothetical protein